MYNKRYVYRPHDFSLYRDSHGFYNLTYSFGSRTFDVFGEFFVDKFGYLHHTHVTSSGREFPFKVKISKYLNESENLF